MADADKLKKVTEIVRAMNTEGLAISDIKDSLRQIGVKEEDINSIIKQAAAEPTTKDVHEAVKSVEMKIGEPLARSIEEHKQLTEEVRDKVEDMSAGMEEHSQGLDQLASNLNEHREKLDAIHESIQGLGERHEELHEKVKDLSSISDEFAEMREIMLDMKAMLGALRDLNNKILETNKEMLMRLRMK